MAGTDTDDFLTAEPAVVVRTEGDAFTESFQQVDEIVEMSESYRPSSPVRLPFSERRKTQQGVSLRRAVHQLSTPRVRTGSIDSQLYDQLNIDERAGISPFERSMSSRNMDQTVAHGSDWQSKANGSMTSLLSTVSKAKSLKSQASDGVSEPEDISERSGTNYSAKEITEVSCGTCMSLESRESKQNNLKTARC